MPFSTPASFGSLSGSPSDNAALQAALDAAGGSLAIPATAWVQTAGNGGNDGTGELGNPAKPYATMQAAYNAGGTILHVGAGTFAGITVSANLVVSFIGAGRARTTIGLLRSTAGTAVVQDLGMHSATVGKIATYGEDSTTPGSPGQAGRSCVVHGCYCNYVWARGGAGSPGDVESEINGSDGADGGAVELNYTTVTNDVLSHGGGGGAPYDDSISGANGGNGASGANVTCNNVVVGGGIFLGGGAGGTGVNGGYDGSHGSGANLIGTDIRADSVWMDAGGDDSSMPGSIDAQRLSITSLYIGASSSNAGTIAGGLILIAGVSATMSPNITALASNIGGVGS